MAVTTELIRIQTANEISPCRLVRSTERPIRYCGYTLDGSVIVTCSYAFTEAMDAVTGELLGCWTHGFPSSSRAVCMHADSGRIASMDDSGSIHVRDIVSGLDILTRLGNMHCNAKRHICFSPDGRWLAHSDGQGLVEVWQLNGNKLTCHWQQRLNKACRISFSPESRHLIVSNDQGDVIVWRTVTGDYNPAIAGILNAVFAFRSDGQQLVTIRNTYDQLLLCFWEWPKRRLQLETASRHHIVDAGLSCLVYSPNGQKFAVLTEKYIMFWDAVYGIELGYVTGFCGRPDKMTCAFSPDSLKFIAGDAMGVIRIWDSESSQLVSLLREHWSEISSIAVSPDGSSFTSSDTDGILKVWNLSLCEGIFHFHGHLNRIAQMSISPLGNFIATSDIGGMICLWDLHTGNEISRWQFNEDPIKLLEFRPDDSQLAVMGRSSLLIYDINNTVHTVEPLESNYFVHMESIHFSSDGNSIALKGIHHGYDIEIWHREKGEHITLNGFTDVEYMQFDPIEEKLWICLKNGKLEEWCTADNSSKKRTYLLPQLSGKQSVQRGSLNLAPDGSWMVWSTGAGSLTFWNRETGQQIARDCGCGSSPVVTVRRQDGRYLASCDITGKITLWNPLQQKKLGIFGGAGRLTCISYSPTGRGLAAGRPDGTVAIWHKALGVKHRKGCGIKQQNPDKLAFHAGSTDNEFDNPSIARVEFAKKDNMIIALTIQGKMKIWDSFEEKEQLLPDGLPNKPVTAFAAKDNWLVVAVDNEIFSLNLQKFNSFCPLGRHADFIHTLEFDNNGHCLISADKSAVKYWSIEQGAMLNSWDCLKCENALISPSGNITAATRHISKQFLESRSSSDFSAIGLPSPEHEVDGKTLVDKSSEKIIGSAEQCTTFQEWQSPDGQYSLQHNPTASLLILKLLPNGFEVMQHSTVGLHINVIWRSDSKKVCIGHDNCRLIWLSIKPEFPTSEQTVMTIGSTGKSMLRTSHVSNSLPAV